MGASPRVASRDGAGAPGSADCPGHHPLAATSAAAIAAAAGGGILSGLAATQAGEERSEGEDVGGHEAKILFEAGGWELSRVRLGSGCQESG